MSEVRSHSLGKDPFLADPRFRLLDRAETRALLGSVSRQPGFVLPTGIALPQRYVWRTRRVSGAEFRDLCLSGIYISIWPLRTHFDDCAFDEVEFDGLYCRNVDFDACVFRHSRLGKRTLSCLDNCRVTASRFEAFEFGGGQALRSAFQDCSFVDSGTSGFSFRGTHFVRCTWSGRLKSAGFVDCSFVDCSFVDCDFESVKFDDCAIVGGSRAGLKLPLGAEGLHVSG